MEIQQGLLSSEDASKHCLCFMRHVTNLEEHVTSRRAQKYLDTIRVNGEMTVCLVSLEILLRYFDMIMMWCELVPGFTNSPCDFLLNADFSDLSTQHLLTFSVAVRWSRTLFLDNLRDPNIGTHTHKRLWRRFCHFILCFRDATTMCSTNWQLTYLFIYLLAYWLHQLSSFTLSLACV